MKEQPLIETKQKTGLIIVIILAIIELIAVWIFSIYIASKTLHSDIDILFLPVFFGMVVILVLSLFFFPNRLDQLKLFSDRLEIIPLLRFRRKTIMIHDITSWSEYNYDGRLANSNGRFNFFSIYTANDYYNINLRYHATSDDLKIYEDLKERLTTGQPQITHKEKSNLLYVWGGFFLFVSLCLFYHGVSVYRSNSKTVTSADFLTISGVIYNERFLHGKNGSVGVRITLDDNPNIPFAVPNTYDFIKNVHAGDSIYLDVLADEYHEKLSDGSVDPAQGQRSIYSNSINAYGMRDSRQRYQAINIEAFNAQRRKQPLFFFIVGLFPLAMAGYMIRGNYKLRNPKEP